MKILQRVRFKRDVEEVPAGELGTIVHIYPREEAYEVEWDDKCVVTCVSDDLEVYEE